MMISPEHPKVMPIPHSGCWAWIGATGTDGYGVTWDGARYRRAHRLAWAQRHGDPGSLKVLHRCDVPCCVNPDHLFLGTDADNMADMVAKGRSLQGERAPGAKFTEELVRAIIADPRPVVEASRAYGVSDSTVSALRLGKSWRHLQRSPKQ